MGCCLVFLAFFFTLPIGLALNMENAANSNYYRYNDYEPFIQDGTMTDLQYKARLLELKTEVVLNGVEYGNGMIAFLMITAAVVIGVSSFAYLHNKKKVDFYHSIPVRREALFGAQFSGGIFMVGAAMGLICFFSQGWLCPTACLWEGYWEPWPGDGPLICCITPSCIQWLWRP